MKVILHADQEMAGEIQDNRVGTRRLSSWELELSGAPSELYSVLEGLRPCSFRACDGDDHDAVIDAIFNR